MHFITTHLSSWAISSWTHLLSTHLRGQSPSVIFVGNHHLLWQNTFHTTIKMGFASNSFTNSFNNNYHHCCWVSSLGNQLILYLFGNQLTSQPNHTAVIFLSTHLHADPHITHIILVRNSYQINLTTTQQPPPKTHLECK